MLKTRIITALAVLFIVLITLFALPSWAWGVLTFGLVIAASLEWRRFCAMSIAGGNLYLALSLVLSAALFFAYLNGAVAGIEFSQLKRVAFILSTAFWFLVVPLWLAKSWRPTSSALMGITGWLVIFPTWLALLSMRDVSPWVFLSFAAIVWVADIAAYFVGRRFGKHKLAPAISPGKTIEGALGGVAGVVVFYFAWRYLIANTAVNTEDWSRVLLSQGWLLLALFMLLSVMSVLGDLFESWMKRGAGLKDSGTLLPGHGGILDRIDALTSTLPVAALYLLLTSNY